MALLGSGDFFHKTCRVFQSICTLTSTQRHFAICISDRLCELIIRFSLRTQLFSGMLHLNNYVACRIGQQRLINNPLKFHGIILSPRIIQTRKDLWKSSGPAPCSMQGPPQG